MFFSVLFFSFFVYVPTNSHNQSYDQRHIKTMPMCCSCEPRALCGWFDHIILWLDVRVCSAHAVLDEMATISAVLYANTNLPELKTDFPVWTERCKQILKKWRALSTEEKAPFLQKARDNRSALRMKKAQHVSIYFRLLMFFFTFTAAIDRIF